jgi:hypothetical protein
VGQALDVSTLQIKGSIRGKMVFACHLELQLSMTSKRSLGLTTVGPRAVVNLTSLHAYKEIKAWA